MGGKRRDGGSTDLPWLVFLLLIAFASLLGAVFVGGSVSVLVAASPQVAITSAETTAAAARFTFESDTPSADFQCRLDYGQWTGCVSPVLFEPGAEAAHTFEVRAFAPSRPHFSIPSAHEWDSSVATPSATPTTTPTATFTPSPTPAASVTPTLASLPDLALAVGGVGPELSDHVIDTVGIRVTNLGNGPSTPTDVELVLLWQSAFRSADGLPSIDEGVVLSIWPVDALQPGMSAQIDTTSVAIPEAFRDASNLVVCARADPRGELIESDESNNVACSEPFRVAPMPDLIVSISGPPSRDYRAGDVIGDLIEASVANQGSAASEPTLVVMFLRQASPRSVPGIEEPILGRAQISSLAPGESVPVDMAPVTLPVRYLEVAAPVVLCAQVDFGGVVNESDESNNVQCSEPFQLTPLPDLVVGIDIFGFVRGATVLFSGDHIERRVGVTVKNQGFGPADPTLVNLYFRNAAGAFERLGATSLKIDGLPAEGVVSFQPDSLQIPESFLGMYSACAQVDPEDNANEFDESNNLDCSPEFTVVPPVE